VFKPAKGPRPANDVVPPTPGDHARDDMRLVARAARTGDERAVRTLLSGVGPAMLRVIRKILGATDRDEHDVLQEAMFGLLRGLGGFREECSVMHFACRVAVMTALAARRQRRARGWGGEAQESGDVVERVPSGAPDPAAEAEAAARRAVLWRLLDALPVAQAEALALHCIEGFTVEEVAAACGCPTETVKSRLRTSKAALRGTIATDLVARDLLMRGP
jgi:RNA polymerase sigma factor (sigma-70 family)